MRGYSLVELLLTVAVVVTLAAISMPMLGNSLEHSRLRGAAFHMSARLYLVRSQAVRRHGRNEAESARVVGFGQDECGHEVARRRDVEGVQAGHDA